MLVAAILGAENMIGTHLGRLEPERCISPRQYIGFDTEGGEIEIMNNILRDHRHLHLLADGHVKLVDLPMSGR